MVSCSTRWPTGTTIPQLGFGVAQVDDTTAEVAVAEALRVGYRHVGTTAGSPNEGGISAGPSPPQVLTPTVYITAKVGNDDQGYDSTFTR